MRPWIAAAITVAAVVSLGYVHPFGNPRAEPAEGLGTLLQGANMLTRITRRLCWCRSARTATRDETRWPLYARMAPGSWLIERDIVEARKEDGPPR